jgi:hypothetical protein
VVTASATQPPTVDTAARNEILTQVDTLLEAGDANVCDLLMQHKVLLEGALGADYRMIAEAVDNFDFEAALAALRAARSDS